MATHRISFPHVTRNRDSSSDRAQLARSQEHPEPNFALFMLAPVVIALTTVAVAWISKVSF